MTAQFPELIDMHRQLAARNAVVDGEIVALDRDGRPSFERMQDRFHRTPEELARNKGRVPVQFLAFDLLWLDGQPCSTCRWSSGGPGWPRCWSRPGTSACPRSSRAPGPGSSSRSRRWSWRGSWPSGRPAPTGRGPLARLAQGQGPLPPGLRDRRLDAGQGRPGGHPGLAAAGGVRRRPAALRRQRRHRLHPRLPGRPAGQAGRAGGPPAHVRGLRGHPRPRGARFVRPELVCEVEYLWTQDDKLRAPRSRASVPTSRPPTPAASTRCPS